jgi:hypothetical protein
VLALAALVCVIVAACATSLAMRARAEASSADSPVPLRDAQTVVLPAAAITQKMPDDVVIGEVSADRGDTAAVELSFHESSDGKHKVVKQRSSIDNRYYLVAATLAEREKAADTLAELNRRAQHLLHAVKERVDAGAVVAPDGMDITGNMGRLVEKHYKKDLPYAEYFNPHDKTVGSNADKGVLIEVCLRSKFDPKSWNSINTLTRVQVHELAHSADFHFRADGEDAHGKDFYRLMNYLLAVAEQEGLYSCAEYTASGGAFCGLRLTENEVECGKEGVK